MNEIDLWPGNIDIAPATLYDLSVPLEQGRTNEIHEQ